MGLFSWFRRPVAWQVGRALPQHADTISRLHSRNFSRGWSEEEVLGLLQESTVCGDILCRKASRMEIEGFALSRHAAEEAEILSIAVDSPLQNKGGGRALLKQHLGQLLTRGVRRVVLEVEETNIPAIRLYERFGFKQVGERPAYYAKPDGTRANARVMALDFP